MGELVVRPARADELAGVLAFWVGAAENGHRPEDTGDAIAALHRRDPDALLLAVDGGGDGGGDGDGDGGGDGGGDEIVGTIIAGWDGWRCHLYRLAVSPERRRQGIGRLLISAAEERFRALGGTRADAMVLDDNEGAHAIWGARSYARQPEWSRWVKPI